jgi:hypothetical protein
MVGESVGRRNGRQHRVGPVHTGCNNDSFPAYEYTKVTLKVREDVKSRKQSQLRHVMSLFGR